MADSSAKPKVFEVACNAAWYDTDQQDSFLQSCLAWSEAARTGWYREMSKQYGGKAPTHLPRINRISVVSGRLVAQGDVVRAKCWVASVANKSFEIHCEMSCEGEVFARVENVRVLLNPAEANLSILRAMILDKNEGALPRFDDVEESSDVRVVRITTRLSDIDAVGHVNMTAYPRFLMNAFWNDANDPIRIVNRLDIDYIAEVGPHQQIDLCLRKAKGSDSIMYVLAVDVATGKVLNRSRFEMDTEASEVRYDYRHPRTGASSARLISYARDRIEIKGPFRTCQVVGWENTTTSTGYSIAMLKWNDSALAPLWVQMALKSILPFDSLVGRKIVVMQRNVHVQVFRRPIVATVLVADAWISKVGKSSIELTSHWRDAATGEDVFTCIVTKVVVDLETRKGVESVFFDPQHFKALYADVSNVNIPAPPLPAKGSQPVFTYKPILRHQDLDFQRHMNANMYMAHVHDAKEAWVKSKGGQSSIAYELALPERISSDKSRDNWISSFGVDYMGENKLGEDLIINIFQDGQVLWFMFDVKGKTRTRVWALTKNDLPPFNPFVLNEPKFYSKPHMIVEGVDASMWGADSIPSTVIPYTFPQQTTSARL